MKDDPQSILPLHRKYNISDWVFVYGLPTNDREFQVAQAYGEFCIEMSYGYYYKNILCLFEKYIKPLSKIGLHIDGFASSRKYSGVLRGNTPSVLFTHCSNSKWLEFSDGLIPFSLIQSRMKASFVGIAEICACAPLELNYIMKRKSPNSTIVVPKNELTADIWLLYYAKFFLEFASHPTSYWDACIAARHAISSITDTAS